MSKQNQSSIKEAIQDLLVGILARGGFGEHRSRQRGEAFLAGGIVLRPDFEPEAEGDGRVIRDGQEHRGIGTAGHDGGGAGGGAHGCGGGASRELQ